MLKKTLPFFLSVVVVAADQISKLLVIKFVPYGSIAGQFLGDFLRITHVRNLGAVFSLGNSLPEGLRRLFLIILPMIVLVVLVFTYMRSDEVTLGQRWCLAGILGGGVGNLFDRIFRPEGVVDFIDVKFYGIFGWERWPTFNIADSSIVVCGILLMIFLLKDGIKPGPMETVHEKED